MRVLRVSMFVHARACPFVRCVCARVCVCVLRVCMFVYERYDIEAG